MYTFIDIFKVLNLDVVLEYISSRKPPETHATFPIFNENILLLRHRSLLLDLSLIHI